MKCGSGTGRRPVGGLTVFHYTQKQFGVKEGKCRKKKKTEIWACRTEFFCIGRRWESAVFS